MTLSLRRPPQTTSWACTSPTDEATRRAGKVRSPKFGLLLTVAVMFADGALVLLVRPDVGVREGWCSLHGLLVYP
jgi:hypothetical protein